MKKETATRRWGLAGAGIFILLLLMVNAAIAQNSIPQNHASQVNTIKYNANMRISDLAGRPDTDLVEFSDGQHLRLGELRKLEGVQKKMMAAKPGSKKSPLLNARPDASNVKMKIQSDADLHAALKRPDNETVQLPSGRLATAGQLKFLQEGEKRLGRRFIPESQRPDLSGPAFKISENLTEEEWKSLRQKPDSTVLESPSGIRITLGELKNHFGADLFAPAGQKRDVSIPGPKTSPLRRVE
jgi:hypothetical protein